MYVRITDKDGNEVECKHTVRNCGDLYLDISNLKDDIFIEYKSVAEYFDQMRGCSVIKTEDRRCRLPIELIKETKDFHEIGESGLRRLKDDYLCSNNVVRIWLV